MIAHSNAAPNLSCPGNFAFTYTDQASLDESFADYLRAFRTSEDGCAITSVTDLSTLDAPSFTGGCITINFTATDCEGTDSCSATFIANGPTLNTEAVLDIPENMTLANCMDDEQAMTAFLAWIGEFGFTGGCGGTTATDLSTFSPPGCGGTTTVAYNVTSAGITIGETRTFSIPAAVIAPDPAAAVPTMGQWGIICLLLIIMIGGVLELRRSSSLLSTK